MELDGNYAASLSLTPTLWDNESKSLDGRMITAFVARDTVLFTSENNAKSMAMLDTLLMNYLYDAYAISNKLYSWDSGKWHLYKQFDLQHE